MLFPISDDNRGISGPCYVTWTLLALNILVFGYQSSNPEFTYAWSTIPKEITTGQDITEPVVIRSEGKDIEIPHVPGPPIIYLTLFSAMFMHGGIGHLLGNMLYIWIFGDNVEHRFGHLLFLVFYLVSGLVATFAQILISPNSVIPNLGASGAIFGVLGAYMVLFPRNKVNAVVIYVVVSLPAVAVIGLFAVMQFIQGYSTFFGANSQAGGVAYMAHIGGLIAGVAMGWFVRTMYVKEEPDSTLYRQYRDDPKTKQWW